MTLSAQDIFDGETWSRDPDTASAATPFPVSPSLLARRDAGALANAGRGVLQRTVELEVVPRLVRGLRARASRAPARQPRLSVLVEELARSVLLEDAAAAAALVVRLDRRLSAESLLLDLLAPAARRLGEFWTDDLCDFTEVTMGLGRLQQFMRARERAFLAEAPAAPVCGGILLLAFVEEQHTFGFSMVAEFFRRAGWGVRSRAIASAADSARLVGEAWFEVVGFSVGSETRLDALAGAIRQVRHASCNPAIGILVGGPLFLEDPGLAARVGADGTAADGRGAVSKAQDLMARQFAGA